MSKLFVLTGPDGSGKSTLILRLLKQNPQWVTASIWDPLVDLHGMDKAAIQSYLRTLSPRARTSFLLHALQESLHRAEKPQKAILFDSYGYKFFVSQSLMGDPTGARVLIDQLPKPHLVFYLECSPETALQRKRQVGLSEYESGFSKDKEAQFLQIQTQSHSLWSDLAKDQGDWRILRESLSLEEKTQLCLDQMDGKLK